MRNVPENKGAFVKPGKRLYLTPEGELTEHPEGAAVLYCTEHSYVPRAEYERLMGKRKDDSNRRRRSRKDIDTAG